MDIDNSWDALLNPGSATRYFEGYAASPFQPQLASYHPHNAWWLAELSRWSYRLHPQERPGMPANHSRIRFLEQVGLEEVRFLNPRESQCSVIATRPGTPPEAAFSVVVFRGTDSLREWMNNFKTAPRSWRGPGRVHEGFALALETVWDDVQACLSPLPGPCFYTGHSLGAALATLAASLSFPHAVYHFGSPRVGDAAFADALQGKPIFRMVHDRDVVASVPPRFLGFEHVGVRHHLHKNGSRKVHPEGEEDDTGPGNRDVLDGIASWFGDPAKPPVFFSDHAPVNYVALLQRELGD